MKKALILLALFNSLPLFAGPNNTGYVLVTEIKVWTNYIDIYLETSNICVNESNQQHQYRYILNKEEKEMYSLLLSAMTAKMSANVNYNCNTSNNLAYIDGVRVKP